MIERINSAMILNEIDMLIFDPDHCKVNDFCSKFSKISKIPLEKVVEILNYLSEKEFINELPDANEENQFQKNIDLKITTKGREFLEQNKTNNLDFIHREIEGKVKIQLDSIDGIDKKLNLNLVFISGFLGFMFNSDWFTNLPYCVFMPILIGFSVAIALNLYGMFVRLYAVDPAPKHLISNYFDKTFLYTLYSVANSKAEAHKENKKIIRSKKLYANFSYIVISVSVFYLLLYFIV